MSKILSFQLGDQNHQVYVEVSSVPQEGKNDGLMGNSGASEVIEHVGHSFSEALAAAQVAAKEVLDGFVEHLKPTELELCFGLKFSAKAGVVIASTDAEATFNIKAKWAKEDEED